jgi:AraC-like DNA-binding protein
VFTRQVGAPFRRYRAWNRMRMAISQVVEGANLTEAAHAAGFSDSAHFSHDYRRTFGAAPSLTLRNKALGK